MKKTLIALSLLTSVSAIAQSGPQFNNLTKEDVEDITREIGVNFAHTVVSSPQTDGGWGVEVGVIAGRTNSPDFQEVIEASGGEGDDFENLYHAGLAARVHFPLDIFAELSVLPEREIEDVSVENRSLGIGWNFGGFFNWPVDVAIGFGRSTGEISFSQTAPVAANIKLETTSTISWIGVSKTFLFVTPYVKVGRSQIEGDLDATASILVYTTSQKESVDLDGGYLAAGATFDFAFLSLGVEFTQMQDIKRTTAKLAFSF